MLKLGTASISDLMLGTTRITKAYLGSGLVWQKATPITYDAEVEYLQSTGTQWIDTGLKATEKTAATTRVAWMDVSGYDKVAFGVDNGSTFNGGFTLQTTSNGVVIRFIRGNQYEDVKVPPNNSNPVANTIYDISVGPDGIEVNGTLTAITDTSAFTTTGNLPLFAWRRSANIFNYGTVKIGKTKIY